MIGIKNVVVQSGYSYQNYLKKQLEGVFQNLEVRHDYNAKDLTNPAQPLAQTQAEAQTNLLTLYTRAGGSLFDSWGLSGHLNQDKIATIANLQMGKDPRTNAHIKIKAHTIQAITDIDGIEVKLSKQDIQRGYYTDAENVKMPFNASDVKTITGFKKKTDIEFIFTQDATISYAIPLMNAQDKADAEQMLMQTAIDVHDQVIKQYLKDYLGNTGDTAYYSYYHNDNRTHQPSSHVHLLVPNMVRLADGTIRAIEIPEMRQKDFHAMIDYQYKSMLVAKWNARFTGYQLEAYDQDLETITANSYAEIKDWRIAFDEASLEKIRQNSKAKELIDTKISEEKKDLFNKVELKRMAINNKAGKLGLFNQTNLAAENTLTTRLENLNHAYERQLKFLSSVKHRADVWSAIKQPKKNQAKPLKDLQLSSDVASMGLQLKAQSEVGVAFKPKSNQAILDTLTNTSPFFTRNGLIIALAKNHGHGAKAQKLADKLLRTLTKSKVILQAGSNGNQQCNYTTHALIAMEEQNVSLMRELFNAKQDLRVENIQTEINAIVNETGITPNAEQQDFISTVFNDKKGQIVIGLPGTGKSLAVSWATKIANQHGYRTIGLAPTGKVATALANETDCNITATIDKFNLDVANGKIQLTANDIIFLDEASMVGTRNMHQLLSAAHLANAKVVLVGDPNQIQSVSTGNTLAEFLNDAEIKPQVNYLLEIRRQKNAVALEVAETTALKAVYQSDVMKQVKADGAHVMKALELLETSGNISNQHITTTDTISAISEAYLTDINLFKDKLLLTSTNKSIDRINGIIQEKRIESGELAGDCYENRKGRFFVGDRIVMEKTNKDVYKNGDFGTIVGMSNGQLTIQFDSDKIKTINSPQMMRLAYAITFEKSQGMTVNQTYIYGENAFNNNQELFNVGMTRARFNTSLYTTHSEHHEVVASFKRESNRVSLIALGKTLKAKVAQPNLNQQMMARAEEVVNHTLSSIERLKLGGLGQLSSNPMVINLKAMVQGKLNSVVKAHEIIQPTIEPVLVEMSVKPRKSARKAKVAGKLKGSGVLLR